MVKKTIIALACVLIASPAFAQTITTARGIIGQRLDDYCRGSNGNRTGHSSEEGTAASYQPAGTLVIRTDSANPERFDMSGPGLVFDKFGRPVPARSNQAHAWVCFTPATATRSGRSRRRVGLTEGVPVEYVRPATVQGRHGQA